MVVVVVAVVDYYPHLKEEDWKTKEALVPDVQTLHPHWPAVTKLLDPWLCCVVLCCKRTRSPDHERLKVGRT